MRSRQKFRFRSYCIVLVIGYWACCCMVFRYLYPECSLSTNGFCTQDASDFGCKTRVVSFSLYKAEWDTVNGTIEKNFISGIHPNLKRIREFYPGWIMRLYTNLDLSHYLQNISSEQDFLVCDVRRLPILNNVSNGMLWRFLPILDPNVDVFVSRDLDSLVNERELSAVSQWLESDKIFHNMRDHRFHLEHVMGGMWGAKNFAMAPEMRHAMRELFATNNQTKGLNDQGILKQILYKSYKNHLMTHDSYHCKKMGGTIPFPERRKDIHDFVGSKRFLQTVPKVVDKCPVACRPNYGKNWTYC